MGLRTMVGGVGMRCGREPCAETRVSDASQCLHFCFTSRLPVVIALLKFALFSTCSKLSHYSFNPVKLRTNDNDSKDSWWQGCCEAAE